MGRMGGMGSMEEGEWCLGGGLGADGWLVFLLI